MRGSPKTLWGGIGNPAGAQTEMRRNIAAGMTTLASDPLKRSTMSRWTETTCVLSTGQRNAQQEMIIAKGFSRRPRTWAPRQRRGVNG